MLPNFFFLFEFSFYCFDCVSHGLTLKNSSGWTTLLCEDLGLDCRPGAWKKYFLSSSFHKTISYRFCNKRARSGDRRQGGGRVENTS